MAINSLSPAFVKLYTVVAGHQHVMTIPTKFSGTPVPGEAPNLLAHNASSVGFASALDNLSTYAKVFLASADGAIDYAEAWSQPNPTDDPVWIYTYQISDDGTSVGATVVANQSVWTFRSANGGVFRLYLMETALAVNIALPYTQFESDKKALADYITSALSWIYARDNGAPVVCLGYKSKFNDVLRRKYLTG